jgi:hypothetical protein
MKAEYPNENFSTNEIENKREELEKKFARFKITVNAPNATLKKISDEDIIKLLKEEKELNSFQQVSEQRLRNTVFNI